MKILKFAKPYLIRFAAHLCLQSLIAICLWGISLCLPYTVGSYLDVLITSPDNLGIKTTILTLAFLWTFQIVLSYISNIVLTSISSKISFLINKDVLEYISRLTVGYFSKTNHAYLNQRVSTDCKIITRYILGDIQQLIMHLLSVVFSGYIVASVNISIFVILCILIPIYLVVYFCFKKPLYDLQYQYSEAYSRYYASVDKLLANMKIIKMHEWHSYFFTRVSHTYSDTYKSSMNNAKIGYFFSNVDAVIRYLANIAIFSCAGVLVLNGEMSVGELTMVNSYGLTVISCIGSIVQFGKQHSQACVAFDRVCALYQEQQESCGCRILDDVSEINVENLGFSYGDRQVINNVSFTLSKGKLHALVGENGSGKSTLINILCGLEQEYQGTIRFDGIDLRKLDHHNLRKNVIAIVEQEPKLIFQTLEENVRAENGKAKTVNFWMEKFGLNTYHANVYFNTACQSGGEGRLSGGEKQKIALIRALSKETDILILDEPNSAFDAESTSLLCEVLNSIKKEKIVLMVTHRDELLSISDTIISI